MIHEAQVNLAGYVATDPKFRKVAGDTSSTKLRVAYTARRRDRETGEWGDGPTSFVNVQCWRTLADNVAMSVHKGEPVLVMGRLQVRRYDDAEGVPRTAVEIEATSVGHDLARGVAKFSRTRWPVAAGAEVPGTEVPGTEVPGTPGAEDGVEPVGGLETGAQSALGGTAPDGDGVVDERAVAEFARELTETLGTAGPTGPAGPETGTGAEPGDGAAADTEVGVPA